MSGPWHRSDVARILAEPMRVALGQAIIIENVTGAAGTIGTGNVARAAPTGQLEQLGELGCHHDVARERRQVRLWVLERLGFCEGALEVWSFTGPNRGDDSRRFTKSMMGNASWAPTRA